MASGPCIADQTTGLGRLQYPSSRLVRLTVCPACRDPRHGLHTAQYWPPPGAEAAGSANEDGLPTDLFDGQSSSQSGWMMPNEAGCAL